MTINFTVIAHVFLSVYLQRGTYLPQAHTSTMELRAIIQQFYHELLPILSKQPVHIKTSAKVNSSSCIYSTLGTLSCI